MLQIIKLSALTIVALFAIFSYEIYPQTLFSGGRISISALSFNYGTRRVNSLCGFTFDVSNLGTQPLVINSITFSTQRFRFDNTNVNFPVTIDAQRSRTFRIWFSPNGVSTFS